MSCPVLFVTLVYCGQAVGWIKMKLGMQAGLGHDHIVLDWDRERGTASRFFLAHVYCGHDRPFQLLLSPCLAFNGL